jgi:hypothetical protein
MSMFHNVPPVPHKKMERPWRSMNFYYGPSTMDHGLSPSMNYEPSTMNFLLLTFTNKQIFIL